MKLPIFLWSTWGSTFFLGHRLKASGHTVTLYIKEESCRNIGKGLIPKTTDPMPPRDALVVFDGIGQGELGSLLRKRGQLVIGGNPFDRKLEVDRWSGLEIMRSAGIKTPESKQFLNTASAEKFVQERGGEWFVKVSGTSVPEDSTCNGNADVLGRFLHWMGTQPGDKRFVLQEKITGVEISTNGWFDGFDFVRPWDLTLEDKKFLEGDLGPRTGCESCVVFTGEHPIGDQTLGKLVPVLRREGYVGPVDLNAIVTKDGTIYGLEWTARLGFDATQAWTQLLPRETLVDQLEAFSRGRLRQWGYFPGTAATLRVTVPPYPEAAATDLKHKIGYPVNKEWLSGDPFQPEDVMSGEGGPVLSGASGIVGVLAERGKTYETLKSSLKARADQLKLPGKQYRINPLTRYEDDMATLAKLKLVASGQAVTGPDRGLVAAASA